MSVTDLYINEYGEVSSVPPQTKVLRRVRCPDCAWWQFEGEESVGMTPCPSCSSIGFTWVE